MNPESHVGVGLLQVLADILSVAVPVTAMLALWSAVSLSFSDIFQQPSRRACISGICSELLSENPLTSI